jgi:hypothetical protein
MTGKANDAVAAPSWLESALIRRVAAPPAFRDDFTATALVSIMGKFCAWAVYPLNAWTTLFMQWVHE